MVLSVSPDMHRCEVVFSSELKGVYIGGHVVTLFHGQHGEQHFLIVFLVLKFCNPSEPNTSKSTKYSTSNTFFSYSWLLFIVNFVNLIISDTQRNLPACASQSGKRHRNMHYQNTCKCATGGMLLNILKPVISFWIVASIIHVGH